MKPEPLKTTGKRKIEMSTAEWIGRLVTPISEKYKKGYGKIITLRKEEEIKSAVEWLKDKDEWVYMDILGFLQSFLSEGECKTVEDKLNLLTMNRNKTFEDVIK